MDENTRPTEREDIALELNFVPTWARKSPASNPYSGFSGPSAREERGTERRGASGRDRPRRPMPDRGARPPRRDEPRRAPEGAPSSATPSFPPPADRGARPSPRADRSGPGRHGGDRYERAAPRLPINVSFLPERLRLGALVHKVHSTRRAYPLADLAGLFLNSAEATLIKLEIRRGPAGREGGEDLRFHQCKACRAVFLQEAELRAHIVARHLETYFDREDLLGEPPTGQFVCIARCGLSGELLGPPNHHSYNDRVAALHAERYPSMSLDEYRQRIETVRDEALIEQWREACRKQTVFRRKAKSPAEGKGGKSREALAPAPAAAVADAAVEGASETAPDAAVEPVADAAPALTEREARTWMLDHAVPGLSLTGLRAVLPSVEARALEEGPLRDTIRDAWTRESRFPMTLMLALRPALRHMGLHLFKAQENSAFVTAIRPVPLDPEHAIPAIRHALEYLRAHPGVTRRQMIEDLLPGRPAEDAEVHALLNHMHWLVDKGHVIEFFDGTLAVPGRGGRKPSGADAQA